MVKFEGQSSMKKYFKNKSIKWGLKFWYPCASETGYLEENMGPGVVFKMTESLQNSHCMAFFHIFQQHPTYSESL